MSSKNIRFINFILNKKSTNNKKILNIYKDVIKEKSEVILSLNKKYKDSFSKKILLKLKKINQVLLIGMGGSILGAKAIYKFLQPKHKKFTFIDNFSNTLFKNDNKKKITLIISKSGNTLETISNSNILINKKDTNIFITENRKSYLLELAHKLKSEVIHHNNFIGGRYSVLSEVGMLPAQLMGFKPEKFRRLNKLVDNKYFINSLIQNVSDIFYLTNQKKTNSIILNYDDKSNDLFYWYQQLVAESLGKKSKGILPMISIMPKDNHSLMQYYLDGVKNNFFTFFFVKEKSSKKIRDTQLLKTHLYLKNKSLNDISYSQFIATEKVFKQKKIPYRSFVINNRNEETLGEIFIFFILETILLSRLMKINPFNQPAVELIKQQTKKNLITK
ncbi:glucose-6-phosphate isomerase [Candidatus Pelagibacter sp.]|nr:glucose-6-phosphate isomerase [Candidatus Pelagibacter sp.]